MIIWLTGLSGAGKTTIARLLYQKLPGKNFIVDGDEVRQGINRHLGFCEQDRETSVLNIAHLAKLIDSQCDHTIVACVSPSQSVRDRAYQILGKRPYEIYIKCDLETCKKRDPKGIYALYTDNIVGEHIPYDVPTHPNLIVDTTNTTPTQSIRYILNFL